MTFILLSFFPACSPKPAQRVLTPKDGAEKRAVSPTLVLPTSTKAPPRPAPTEDLSKKRIITCPIDPEDWSLGSGYGTNYRPIQPACVYAGLERTVAWVLAMRSGYSWDRATRELGFLAMPVARIDQAEYVSQFQGEWWVDDDGKVAVAYGLRGCFRTEESPEDQAVVWGKEYPVVCVVAEDAINTRTVYASDGHVSSLPHDPIRTYLLFGYMGDNLWVWLKADEEPHVRIDEPERALDESAAVALLYDARFWDFQWLGSYMHLLGQPLPEVGQPMAQGD